MSTFVLKLIAIISMLIDHIGAILLYDMPIPNLISRCIGRLAFPIFVFLIVEGFYHTSDVKKYLSRLGIFALISEIPFDLAFYRTYFGSDILEDMKLAFSGGDYSFTEDFLGRLLSYQNVFFTLFLGLLAIYIMSLIEKKYHKQLLLSNVLDALVTIAFCVASVFLHTDYGMSGILLIVAFFLFRGSKILLTIALLIVTGTLFRDPNGNITIEVLATLAMVPLAFYNGKKGKSFKYFFYIFYPAHILILFLLSRFI